MDPRCVLCRSDGGEVVWRGGACRVVLVDEPALPGYCRVIWNAHVRELGDLSVGERCALDRTVATVETAIRDALSPAKINIASLGNLVPHVHVHVVPRFADDPYFPGAVWGPAARPVRPRALDAERHARVRDQLRARLGVSSRR